MPRRKQSFCPGEYYHIYNRGASRCVVFHSREEYGLFLTKWREHVISDADVVVISYCLMPNHYHLFVRIGETSFSKSMQRFGTSFVKAWNRHRQRSGVAFERNFSAVHVDCEEYLLHLTRYIHRNPVAAGLVSRPDDWEFSSYRDFIGLRSGTLPECEVILRQFKSREDYRRFVECRSFDASIQHLLIDEEI